MDDTETSEYRASAASQFVADAAGRTLFYPFGWSHPGYVVSDADREQVLREFMARERDISKPLGLMAAGLVSPIGYALYALSVSRPFFALGLFLLVSAIATTAARALLGYRMRALLAGLECVEPYDNTSGQLHRLILRAGIIMAAPERQRNPGTMVPIALRSIARRRRA